MLQVPELAGYLIYCCIMHKEVWLLFQSLKIHFLFSLFFVLVLFQANSAMKVREMFLRRAAGSYTLNVKNNSV